MLEALLARSKPVLLVAVASLTLTSCASHYHVDSPADLDRLPMRRGWTGFNVVAVTPWRYMGSRYQDHEFRYYYNRDNALQYRNVSVARNRTVLTFEEKPFGKIRHWVTMQTDGQTLYYYLLQR